MRCSVVGAGTLEPPLSLAQGVWRLLPAPRLKPCPSQHPALYGRGGHPRWCMVLARQCVLLLNGDVRGVNSDV